MSAWWRMWILSCLLAITLTGCSALVPQASSITWVPLPTIPPLATPTALPKSVAVEPSQVPSPVASSAPATPSPLPTATALPTATLAPSATATPDDTPLRAAWARDQVWIHLVDALKSDALPRQPAWEQGTVEKLIGATRFTYTTPDWRVLVAVPTIQAAQVTYQVQVRGPEDSFLEAQVDSAGVIRVIEFATPIKPLVAATLEQATALPAAPEKTTSVPATPEATVALTVTAQATALPAAHDKPTAAAPATTAPTRQSSVLVDGWMGVIQSVPAGSQGDDRFVAQQPGGAYGITSLVPQIAQELAARRDTGTVLRIWGILDYGAADYNGTQIVVTRVEVVNP